MAGVNHPTMLVPEAETQLDKKKFIYNCHQRVHGNTLEGMPFLLAMTAYLGESHVSHLCRMITYEIQDANSGSGIYNPMLACSAALSVTIGRVFYTVSITNPNSTILTIQQTS